MNGDEREDTTIYKAVINDEEQRPLSLRKKMEEMGYK